MKKIFVFISLCFFVMSSSSVYAQKKLTNKTLAQVQIKKMPIIIDNDLCGDPDGLLALAHQLLCKSTDIRGIVGGHLAKGAGFSVREDQATESCEKARKVIELIGVGWGIPVVPGTETPLSSTTQPAVSEGARLIVSEAHKCTPKDPLYVLCGASLSNIASAWLMDSTIQDRVVLVWIGGEEYPFLGTCPPPGYDNVEYNLNLSIPAAQVIFNRSKLLIWQIPRNVYRQCMYSLDEIRTKLVPAGKIGAYLLEQVENMMNEVEKHGMGMGETYILGDSPLVLLTSLRSGFQSDPASSDYRYVQAPTINDNGNYNFNHSGRLIRVYTHVDTRLMFGDMEAKFSLLKK